MLTAAEQNALNAYEDDEEVEAELADVRGEAPAAPEPGTQEPAAKTPAADKPAPQDGDDDDDNEGGAGDTAAGDTSPAAGDAQAQNVQTQGEPEPERFPDDPLIRVAPEPENYAERMKGYRKELADIEAKYLDGDEAMTAERAGEEKARINESISDLQVQQRMHEQSMRAFQEADTIGWVAAHEAFVKRMKDLGSPVDYSDPNGQAMVLLAAEVQRMNDAKELPGSRLAILVKAEANVARAFGITRTPAQQQAAAAPQKPAAPTRRTAPPPPRTLAHVPSQTRASAELAAQHNPSDRFAGMNFKQVEEAVSKMSDEELYGDRED